MTDEPRRPRLADISPPPLPEVTEGFEVESEIGYVEAPGLDVLLSIIAGELGIIALLLVGTLLVLILR